MIAQVAGHTGGDEVARVRPVGLQPSVDPGPHVFGADGPGVTDASVTDASVTDAGLEFGQEATHEVDTVVQ